MLAEVRTAMDDAMPDAMGKAMTKALDNGEDFLEGVALRRKAIGLVEFRCAAGVGDLQASVGMADAAGSAGEQEDRIAVAGRMAVEAELQRG